MVVTNKVWFQVREAYTKVTFSKFTTAFFIFGFVHCFAQGIIQSLLYSIDTPAAQLVTSIVQEAQVPRHEVAFVTSSGNDVQLQICTEIPIQVSPYPCVTVFDTSDPQAFDQLPPGVRREMFNPDNVVTITSLNSTANNADGVSISLQQGQTQLLDGVCTRVLVYPMQVLQNFQREDISLLFVQFWLLYVSFVAVLQDSVPHTLAVLTARVLVTAWSAFSFWHLGEWDFRYTRLVSDSSSACQVDLLPGYTDTRRGYQIADLALNCTALVLSAILSTNLLKVFSSHAFQRVGPPAEIVRIHRYFQAIYLCLQLASYWLITAMGLWVDQLINTSMKVLSAHTALYITLILFTSIFFIPWVIMGWYAVRREKRRLMAGFLGIGFVFTAGWAVMFYSKIYRWQFIQWPYFGCTTAIAFVVMVMTVVFGVITWRNFDQGLAHYLYVQNVLSSMDFEQAVFEHKVENNGKDLEEDAVKRVLDTRSGFVTFNTPRQHR